MAKWSKAVFNGDERLAIAVVVKASEPQDLYPRAIALRIGIDEGLVRRYLRSLSDAGLLTKTKNKAPVSGKGGRPGELYARTEDDFWQCLEELGKRFRRPRPNK